MTKKKTKYKSAPLSFFITLLCLSLSAASVWLFYKDLNSSSSRADKEQVATITFKHRIAQRKYNDRVVWERLSQDSPLYNGDTIHTADLSDATIHFENGVGIDVAENSMIQLYVDDDGNVKLSVNGGNISVDATNAQSDVLVDMGNNTVANIKKGGKLSASSSGSASSFKVLSGSATISDANGKESATVNAGESVKVSESGKVSQIPITVTSVSENQKVLMFEDDKPLSLEWATSASAEKPQKVIVETSEKKDFSVIKDSITVVDKNSVELPPVDGVLFWRVRLPDDEESAVNGKISFEKIPEVLPKYPSDEVFSSYTEEPVVNLSWSGNEYAKKYKVEVARSADFSAPEIVRETDSQFIALNDLGEGEYFWRVTPYYEFGATASQSKKDGYYDSSEAKSFSVTSKKIEPIETNPDLPSAVLTEPEENQKIGIAYLQNNRTIKFRWDDVADASDYDFVLYQKTENGLKEIYSETDIKETSLSLDLNYFDIASYQWRVTAKNKAKNGFVIQDGKTAAQDFEIDFALPGKIKKHSTGVMYGE